MIRLTMAGGEWTQRKIQWNNGYYRLQLPPEYGEEFYSSQVREVEYRRTGDFFITRPVNKEKRKNATIEIPEKLGDRSSDEQISYLTNVLSGYCIAGVEDIKIEFPSSWTDQTIESFSLIFANAANVHTGLNWDRQSRIFSIDAEISFEEFVSSASTFIYQYFMSPLSGGPVQMGNMSSTEQKIDMQWALITRQAGQDFIELKREAYPRDLCGLYVSKYLEEIMDKAQVIVDLLDQYEGNADVLYEFSSKLYDIFQGSPEMFPETSATIPAFDTQLEEVALKSYHINVDLNDFTEQNRIFQKRREALRDLRSAYVREFEGLGRDGVPSGEIAEIGMLVGQFLTIAEDILRLPRSMTLVGVGAKHVADVHDISLSDE